MTDNINILPIVTCLENVESMKRFLALVTLAK